MMKKRETKTKIHYLNRCFVLEDLNLIKTSYSSNFDFNQYFHNAITFLWELSQLLREKQK